METDVVEVDIVTFDISASSKTSIEFVASECSWEISKLDQIISPFTEA